MLSFHSLLSTAAFAFHVHFQLKDLNASYMDVYGCFFPLCTKTMLEQCSNCVRKHQDVHVGTDELLETPMCCKRWRFLPCYYRMNVKNLR